jgi:hypothetical protein
VTREQYEEVRKVVDWEGSVPKGAKFHVAWFGDDGFHVLDLWDSADDFARFSEERLRAGIEKAGVKGEPRVQFSPAHAIFAPNV